MPLSSVSGLLKVFAATAAAGLLCLGVPPSAAQTAQGSEDQFAVEIPGAAGFPPSYVMLSGNSRGAASYLHDGSLLRVPGADPHRRQPSALELAYKVEGESVSITASVYYGEFDRQRIPVALYDLPKEKVAAHSGGLGQSVPFPEMEQFGLQPLTLKIVAAQPPPSVLPLTWSKEPSLQLEITGADRTFYEVAVHNLSAKAVTALQLVLPEKDGGTRESADSGSHDLIAPGATYQMRVSIPHSGHASGGTFV